VGKKKTFRRQGRGVKNSAWNGTGEKKKKKKKNRGHIREKETWKGAKHMQKKPPGGEEKVPYPGQGPGNRKKEYKIERRRKRSCRTEEESPVRERGEGDFLLPCVRKKEREEGEPLPIG